MSEQVEVKLVTDTQLIVSIQQPDATLVEHLVTLDKTKLDRYRQIQRDFTRMQNELLALIEPD